MTFDELGKWVEGHDRTMADIIDFETWGIVMGLKDMSDNELFETIKEGISPISLDDLKDYWINKDEEEQGEYLEFLRDYFRTHAPSKQ